MTKIDKQEWDQLEKMMDEFDFWTAEQLRTNKDVLDGYTYFLEGSSSSANGKLHQFIVRGSPMYDKMGALCDYLMDYQERLVFKYKQLQK